MIAELLERLEKIVRSGPGIPAEQEARVREDLEEVDRSPFLLQLAYAEPLYDRLEDLNG